MEIYLMFGVIYIEAHSCVKNKHHLFRSPWITNDRSHVSLNSRLKTEQYYILDTSILSCHLADSFHTMKEHESKIDLITVVWELSILSLRLYHCFRISTSTLYRRVLTNNVLALVYLGSSGSLLNMSSWLTSSLQYNAKLYELHNEKQYNAEQCALMSSNFSFSE